MSCKLGDKCDNVFACNILRPNVELLGCNFYKPKKPMTNEEHIHSLNTEQLAEHLLNVWMDGAFNVNAEFGLNEAQIEQHKGYIVEWLKQPHSAKE